MPQIATEEAHCLLGRAREASHLDSLLLAWLVLQLLPLAVVEQLGRETERDQRPWFGGDRGRLNSSANLGCLVGRLQMRGRWSIGQTIDSAHN